MCLRFASGIAAQWSGREAAVCVWCKMTKGKQNNIVMIIIMRIIIIIIIMIMMIIIIIIFLNNNKTLFVDLKKIDY